MEQSTGHPASTVHKALGLIAGDDGQYGEPESFDADLVLIDEVSMLDIYLAKHVLRSVPKGCQLVLIGDADQLPSVGPGAVSVSYTHLLILSEKTVSILAYSLETILAEKYETIIRRNIGTTRARDFYDLYMLCRQHWDEIRFEVLHDAVQHTAKKRGSLEELYDWKDILKEIREEPQLYTLWRNYVAENKYAEGLEFHVILDIVDEIAEMLNF